MGGVTCVHQTLTLVLSLVKYTVTNAHLPTECEDEARAPLGQQKHASPDDDVSQTGFTTREDLKEENKKHNYCQFF